jgi:hypothetical protein
MRPVVVPVSIPVEVPLDPFVRRTMATAQQVDESEGFGLPSTNVIVFSEAGRPIYARYGREEDVARTCGLVQALRASLVSLEDAGLGDIQALRSNKKTMVFLTIRSITMVAISTIEPLSGTRETEAYLRLLLEYVYGQIICSVTEQVQNSFLQDPGFDLQAMLGASTNIINELLDEAGPSGNAGLFLSGCIQTLCPITPEIRDKASNVLQAAGDRVDNTIFGIMMAGEKLLTMIQPNYQPHQMRTSDLYLLMSLARRQPGLTTSELWFPICLPRFNSSGFLYVYTHCLNAATKLCVLLISQIGTPEQFESFRTAAHKIRHELGLPPVVGSVLRILDCDDSNGLPREQKNDVAWQRTEQTGEESDDEYVDASGDGEGMIQIKRDEGISGEIFLQAIYDAVDSVKEDEFLEEYLHMAGAIHFLFRYDGCSDGPAQCVSPRTDYTYSDATSKRRMWCMYQKLNLRLRLSSATAESVMEVFAKGRNVDEATKTNGIEDHCLAIGLAESKPPIQGMTYALDNDELFLAMNGRNFEL